MIKNIDLNKYTEFVQGVTSKASDDLQVFVEAVTLLNNGSDETVAVNAPLLLTSAVGMSGESGEFSEIVKKCVFHGKKLTPELHLHLQKELGDVIWYWTNACRALKVDPNKIIADNVEKLEDRYPGGKFDAWFADNRQLGDI